MNFVNNFNQAMLDSLLIFGFIIGLLVFSFWLGEESTKNNGVYFNDLFEMNCVLSNLDLTYYNYELVNYGWMLKCNYAEGSIIYEIDSFNMTGVICDWCANTIQRSPDII